MPVQLSATVVGGGREGETPVLMADQFLRLCITQFPQSTLALGWAPPAPDPTGLARYNWTDVKLMYDLIDRSVQFIEAGFYLLSSHHFYHLKGFTGMRVIKIIIKNNNENFFIFNHM